MYTGKLSIRELLPATLYETVHISIRLSEPQSLNVVVLSFLCHMKSMYDLQRYASFVILSPSVPESTNQNIWLLYAVNTKINIYEMYHYTQSVLIQVHCILVIV